MNNSTRRCGTSEQERAALTREYGIIFENGRVYISEEFQRRKRRHRRRVTISVSIGLLLLGSVAAFVAYYVTSQSDRKNTNPPGVELYFNTSAPSTEPSPSPTESPSGAPTSVTHHCIVETLAVQHYMTDSMVARMMDPSSPQNRAIQWLANEDPSERDCADENTLRYRYLLALLYFATNGPDWKNRANFLSEQFVCNWWEYRKTGDPIGLWCLQNDDGGVEVYLDLADNNLMGTIPEELVILEEAYAIDLKKNKLTGTLPKTFGDFSMIVQISLEENDLTGAIPDEWGKFPTLALLNVTDNHLNGTIPSALANIPTLGWLYASYNRFTGSVPGFFRDHPVMERILLANNALTGNLEEAVYSLPRRLEYLWLGSNLITGTLPSLLGDAFPNMKSLDLRTNPGLSGTIPASFNKWSKLWQITLNECNLSGEIPFEPYAFPETNMIQLYNNRLSGTVPKSLFTYANLTVLHLSRNKLEGTIPTVVGSATELRELALGWNYLYGTIPTELGYLSNLESFGCSHNKMTGTLPTELGRLLTAKILAVRNNMLTGALPSELGKLTLMTELLLDQNKFVGLLPQTYLGMKRLGYLDVSRNQLVGAMNFLCENDVNIIAADCEPEEIGSQFVAEIICDCCSICCDREGDCFSRENE